MTVAYDTFARITSCRRRLHSSTLNFIRLRNPPSTTLVKNSLPVFPPPVDSFFTGQPYRVIVILRQPAPLCKNVYVKPRLAGRPSRRPRSRKLPSFRESSRPYR